MVFQDTINSFGGIEWFLIAIAALLFILGLAKVGKTKATGTAFKWIGGISLILFLVLPFMGFNLVSQITGGLQPAAVVPGQPTTTPSGTTKVCAVEDTTVTLSSVNKYTEVATGGTHRYRINGNPALTLSDAGTFTASPGDTIDVLWGNETDGSYYGAVSKEVINCMGTQTLSAKRVQNGTMTINVYTEGGDIIDGNGINETLGSGDTANLKWEVRATDQQGYPYGGLFILEVNKTDYDEGDIKLFLDGSELRKVSSPDVQTLGSVDNGLISFESPAIEGANLHIGTLILDVATGINPGNTNDPILRFRPNDYFINEDTGGSFDGPAVEDEDNAVTFGHLTSFTISVN